MAPRWARAETEMGLPELQPLPADPPQEAPVQAPASASPRLSPVVLGLLVALGLTVGTFLASRQPRTAAGTPAAPLEQRLLQAVGASRPEEKLVFSVTPTQPAYTADLLPAGATVMYGFYDLPGVHVSGAPVVRWSRDGKPMGALPASAVAAATRRGRGTITLRAPAGGFTPGIYEVEVAFAGTKFNGSFVTAWAAEVIASQPAPRDAEVVIANAVSAPAVTPDGKANKPQKAFWGSQRIYFVFHYSQAEPGSTIQIKWYGGQQQIQSATSEVLLPSVEGWANGWLQAPFPGLPAGAYHATLNMSGDAKELSRTDFTIAPGTPPVSAPLVVR